MVCCEEENIQAPAICTVCMYCTCKQKFKKLSIDHAMDVVILNFNQAFDRVSHDILVDEMVKCGLGDTAVKWIQSWLSIHFQGVCFNGSVKGHRALF